MATPIHTKLIHKAAREFLQPLGLTQRGRSRLWLDDHGWWTVLVEFQPSGFDRGTYLNVGVDWLWSGMENFSFNLGYRVDSFTRFINEAQFEQALQRIVKQAVSEVLRYRSVCNSVGNVADNLETQPNLTTWQLYYVGVACGLAGRTQTAQNYFNRLLSESSEIYLRNGVVEQRGWHKALKSITTHLKDLLSNNQAFKDSICEVVTNTRRLRGLKHWDRFVF